MLRMYYEPGYDTCAVHTRAVLLLGSSCWVVATNPLLSCVTYRRAVYCAVLVVV